MIETVLAASAIVIVLYYVLVQGLYVLIHAAGLSALSEDLKQSEWGPMWDPFTSPFLPGIAVIVPAYNEEPIIVDNVQSMLNINYPDTEIVVVNDGSDDGTLAALQEAFDLEKVDARPPVEMPAEYVKDVYRSPDASDLVVIDKVNGGRADALNAGLWLTDQPLFCTIDADSLVERDGLLQVVRPFLEAPERTVAAGGNVRVVNGCTVEDGQVLSTQLPRTFIAKLQSMEYLRAFYSGRLGLTKLKSLVLISGAFGLFRTDVVREVGGFDVDTVTEDFELTVRLHRYLMVQDRPYRIDFVPEPIVWTEVPESVEQLGRQRRRWYRGLVDTLVRNRDMIGNPRYGRIGTFALPMFLIIEGLGPLIEGLGYVLLGVGFFAGVVDFWVFATYLVLTMGIGVALSWFSVFSEVWSFRRYEEPREILSLLWNGILENFGFRQWKVVQAWRGLVEYFRGDTSWGAMQRVGFED